MTTKHTMASLEEILASHGITDEQLEARMKTKAIKAEVKLINAEAKLAPLRQPKISHDDKLEQDTELLVSVYKSKLSRSEQGKINQAARTKPYQTGEAHPATRYSDAMITQIRAFTMANKRLVGATLSFTNIGKMLYVPTHMVKNVASPIYRASCKPSEAMVLDALRRVKVVYDRADSLLAQKKSAIAAKVLRGEKADSMARDSEAVSNPIPTCGNADLDVVIQQLYVITGLSINSHTDYMNALLVAEKKVGTQSQARRLRTVAQRYL
jgi:hypothetical protein